MSRFIAGDSRERKKAAISRDAPVGALVFELIDGRPWCMGPSRGRNPTICREPDGLEAQDGGSKIVKGPSAERLHKLGPRRDMSAFGCEPTGRFLLSVFFGPDSMLHPF